MGIAMGIAMASSPLLFVLTMEVTLRSVSHVFIAQNQRLPPLLAFVDDVTLTVLSKSEAADTLTWLKRLFTWRCIKRRPTK